MTHDGVKRLLFIMTAAYPNFKPVDMGRTISVWESMLDQYDDSQGAAALKAYILSDTKGFAPAIGQIVDLIHQDPNQLGELEAWGLVSRALRNSNYGAEQEFAKLPATVKEAVGSPDQLRQWAQMEERTVESVGQSNFLNSYRVAVKRSQQALKMPPDLARLYQRTRLFPELETHEEEPQITEGVPMPEELKRRLYERIS